MPQSVKTGPTGTHAKGISTDLQSVRGDSHIARIAVNQSVSREAVRVAMGQTGLTQQQFADAAGCPESTFSDALNQRGRNLETDWILAQTPAFILAFWQSVERQRGLTSAARQAVKAERIAELVRLIVEVA